jgi:hypothetical protein
MENNVENPFEGIIELKWPGKYCKLEFTDGKWRLIPYGKIESKRALTVSFKLVSLRKIL